MDLRIIDGYVLFKEDRSYEDQLRKDKTSSENPVLSTIIPSISQVVRLGVRAIFDEDSDIQVYPTVAFRASISVVPNEKKRYNPRMSITIVRLQVVITLRNIRSTRIMITKPFEVIAVVYHTFISARITQVLHRVAITDTVIPRLFIVTRTDQVENRCVRVILILPTYHSSHNKRVVL